LPELDEWRTAITHVGYGTIAIAGKDIGELIEHSSFGNLISLLFRGSAASPSQARMIEAILVSLSDHGVHAPSTLATRIAASSGTPLQASVAAGVAAVGDHHGGALGASMELLRGLTGQGTRDLRRSVEDYVSKAKEAKARIPGFGHPYHRPDPRAVALRKVADREGVAGEACMALDVLADVVLSEHEGQLMPNADAAAAAVLLDMQFEPAYGRGFFIVARTAGLVAHAIEEQSRERPVRTIAPERVAYDGPSVG
jgi:citrate synthase